MTDDHLSPLDAANLLAGQAVAAATAFLDGRHDAARLAGEALRLEAQALGFTDPSTNGLLQGVRMLIVACKGIVAADREIEADGAGLILRERWELVAGQLVELIRHQSRMLLEHKTDARRAELQREMDELVAKNDAAEGWGAAVGARHERIVAIRRELDGATEPRG